MKKQDFRQDRRQFLNTLLKSSPLLVLPIDVNAFLEDRMPHFTPYFQIGPDKKPIKRVVWTKRDLENQYPRMSTDSQTIRDLNSDLISDHNPEVIALFQDEEPYDFIGTLEDSEILCEDKPTIKRLSDEYEPRTIALPISTSFDFFNERRELPRGKIYIPPQNFLMEKYERALAEGKGNKFLKVYQEYFSELDSLALDLGFNAIILPESSIDKYIPYNQVRHLSASKRDLKALRG